MFPNNLTHINSINLSLNYILSSINNLKHFLQPDLDVLPTYFIKSCINYIMFPIHYLFNLLILSGSCLDLWKPPM
jgi:hypothetical protein